MPYRTPAGLAKRLDKQRQKQALRRLAVDALKQKPCADCSRTFPPVCMDWDHRNPTEKKKAVSQLISELKSMDTILEEVAKCDLVCANCHRIRTWQTRNPYMNSGNTEPQGSKGQDNV